jgi:hypothetical protein
MYIHIHIDLQEVIVLQIAYIEGIKRQAHEAYGEYRNSSTHSHLHNMESSHLQAPAAYSLSYPGFRCEEMAVRYDRAVYEQRFALNKKYKR